MFRNLIKKNSLIVAAILFACAANHAQTPTPIPSRDKTVDYARRRTAPTVGMGGPVGGPTGLFTIYDGKTLHRNDFTFSFAYSNYQRDPGQASFGQTQSTFNYGVREKVEFFFNVELYRQIKIYNPGLLSGFYLPNSQFVLSSNQLGTAAAFVLTPINNRGLTGALFRPAGNQPFVQFPFVGQATGNFGITGAPPFSGTMAAQANGGRAGNFPGIGSVVGSILPGIVLPPTTTSSANLAQQTTTLAPSFLPDAPFVNRLYGESSFNSFVIGSKIRFRDREKLTNFGVLPFFRFYGDNPNSLAGFNMLQRGASPGGNRGDLGLIGFAASRIGPHANISFNAGYIVTSNPTSSLFGGQRVTLLDRPNEFVYGFGLDYSYFTPQFGDYQPIFEVRGTKYVGSRTPNAFEQNPLELLIGSRMYLPITLLGMDNIGIGAAYRRHLNPQGNNGSNLSINTFNPFSTANGFLIQFWFGRDRVKGRAGATSGELVPLPQPDQSRLTKIVLACPVGLQPRTGSCPVPNPLVTNQAFEARFVDEDGKQMPFGKDPDKELDESLITWVASPNTRVIPDHGSKQVLWDLTGAGPGIYELRALYPDYTIKNRKLVKIGDVELKFTIPVEACVCEIPSPPIECPSSVTVNNPASAVEGTQVTFNSEVTGLPQNANFTYHWEVDHGSILGTNDGHSINVDTTGLGGQTVRATLTLAGLDPRCKSTAQGDMTIARSEPVSIEPLPKECKVFDRYGPIEFNDEKARLDNFAIFLNQEPSAKGYIVAFGEGALSRNIGTRKDPSPGVVTAQYRIDRASRYLSDDRGLSLNRIVSKDGGVFKNSEVDLYICPNGKEPTIAPDPGIQGQGQLPRVKNPPPQSNHHKLHRKKRVKAITKYP